MSRRLRVLPTALCLAAGLLAAPSAHAATGPALRAGAGQADITPPQTGYFLGGWTRADRLALGQSTRLYANTLVLQRGTRKFALVAAEIFAIPAGFQEDVARLVADLGYTRESVLLAASHTHSGPGGFANNPTYNTAAPSIETVDDPASFPAFFNPAPADRAALHVPRQADRRVDPPSRRGPRAGRGRLGPGQAHEPDREPLDRGASRRPRARRPDRIRQGVDGSRRRRAHDRPRGRRPARGQARAARPADGRTCRSAPTRTSPTTAPS